MPLLDCILILYPESIMLCKKAVCNDIYLEVYTPFDFQPITYLVPLSYFDSNVLSVG